MHSVRNDHENRQRLSLQDGVFLTGATGYLGAYLLNELLEQPEARVGCLVRGSDAEAAKGSLLRRMKWYFPDTDWAAFGPRLQVWQGDVGAKQLGLVPRARAEIAAQYRIILNSAANTSHVGLQSQFIKVNTEGVASLLELANEGVPKQLHQVSTLSVKGRARKSEQYETFSEAHLEVGQTFGSAYAESKYRAELLLRKAFGDGTRGAVYRVGYIGPDSVTGQFQHNIQDNNTARYLRACTQLGCAPYRPEVQIALTPVDTVAAAIVRLLTCFDADGSTYHVETDSQVSQYDVIRLLQAVGYPIRLLEVAEFIEKAPRLSQDEDLLSVLVPEPAGDHTELLPLDARATRAALARVGVVYPRVSSTWLGRFVKHAIEVGFLEAPRFWNTGRVVGGLLGP